MRKLSFQPPGMIEAFNATGSHPDDMGEYFTNVVKPRLKAIGRGLSYFEIEELAMRVLAGFQQRSPEFVGHHRPTPAERYFSLGLVSTLVDKSKCNLYNSHNFARAMLRLFEGHNVLVVINHTSVLDTFITYAALSTTFSHGFNFSLMASQVFEYVRITAMMTSGGDKFPVFQPKHIDRMKASDPRAAATMVRQNAKMLRDLKDHCKHGGKMVFMYPERDRDQVMGPPEPRYLRLLECLKPQYGNGEVFIMPMNTTGRCPVIPNAKGTANELDTIFKRVQIGHGHTTCGVAVPLATIENVLEGYNHGELITGILGDTVASEVDPKQRGNTALGLAFLSMVATLSPHDKGIYDCEMASKLALQCFSS